jgi:energy-coupling factor transporter ATP-binding protein EcfA2
MTLVPLGQIRLNFRSHKAAFGWIGLLYCRPKKVEEAGKDLPHWLRAACIFRIYLHAFPYLAVTAVTGRWLLFSILGQSGPGYELPSGFKEILIFNGPFLAVGLIAMPIIGLAIGLATDFASAANLFGTLNRAVSGPFRTFSRVIGKAYGSAFGLGLGISFGLVASLIGDLTNIHFKLFIGSLILGCSLGLAYSLSISRASNLTGGIPSGLALGLAFSLVVGFTSGLNNLPRGLVVGLAFGIAYVVVFLRLYYLPFHWLWLSTLKAEFYRLHPVAWDEVCLLPFPGLDRLLISYTEYEPAIGERELDRLIDEYPSQSQMALRARAILVARRAASAVDLARLDEILTSLPEGKKSFLADTPEFRRRAHEICALQTRLDTLDRPFLREPFAALLVKEIETFEQQIAGFKPPLSIEFRKAARQWLVIARRQLDVSRTAASREPTRQVFRAGDPVDREREAFVLRDAMLGEVERQVMLANGCPGLLVYGRRRMGKSTLLRNLMGLLPPRVHVVNLSMQEARAFASLQDFIRLISLRVTAAVPGVTEAADLPGLQGLLDSTQKLLEAGDRRLLLSLDEYENLDSKIGEGVFPEGLLAVLRESIQTHRRIIWAFAGSHGIDELAHAPWASYLVSARTIEVTPFDPAETRLLLTEPLKHSTLWRATETKRPRFEPGFWGDGGIERIHAEAGGWPHLVQLIAETVVDLVNDSGGADVDDALLERALDRAVVRGNNVLLELMERESRPDEWAYLRAFRSREEQPIPEDEALDRSLRRRRLVVEEAGRYRLRVPLMARWLRQRI